MLRWMLVGFAAIIGGCSGGVNRTVDKPIDEVRAIVQSSANSLGTADYILPGASHRADLMPDGMIWRFTHNEREYGRMTISLASKDANSTQVSTKFEEIGDAAGPGVLFAQEAARGLSEEILTAALDGRQVNATALSDQFKIQAAKDPLAVGGAARAYMDEAANMMKENQPRAGTYSSSGKKQPYDKEQPYDKTPAYDRN
jgi:hypothetical protein